MTHVPASDALRPLALVTGATGGIGLEIARLLAGSHDLVLTARDPERLAALGVEFPAARTLALDLGEPERLVAALPDLPRLDVLVHSAGVADLGNVEDTDAATWRRTLAVNLAAPAELTRLTLPALRAARGHVVFVNSGAGLAASPGWGAYAASKFGLRALADSLRAEEAARGVRVTTVFPGRTATAMQQSVRAQEGGEYEPERYIRPGSVAQAVLTAVTLPRDAHLTEITVRPGP